MIRSGTNLTRWARGRCLPARLIQRAKIVLLSAYGFANHDIAVRLGTSRHRYFASSRQTFSRAKSSQ